MSVSNVCDASAVPPTTALRWIGTLESEGLIVKKSDPLDGRRVFVRLSPKGVSAMEAYFQR
jgi:DNA-binding MarR family transcriptional regulator